MVKLTSMVNVSYEHHVLPNTNHFERLRDEQITKAELYEEVVQSAPQGNRLESNNAAYLSRFGLTSRDRNEGAGPILQEFLQANDADARELVVARHMLITEGYWALVWLLQRAETEGRIFLNYQDIIRTYAACFGVDSVGSSSARHLPFIVSNLHYLGILSSPQPPHARVIMPRFRQAIGFDLQQEMEAFQQLTPFERAVVSTLLSREAFDLDSAVSAGTINDQIETRTDLVFDRGTGIYIAFQGPRLPNFVSRAQGGRGATTPHWLTMNVPTRRTFLLSGIVDSDNVANLSVAAAILRPYTTHLRQIRRRPAALRSGEPLENFGVKILHLFGFTGITKWDKEGESEIDVFGRRTRPILSQCLVQCKESGNPINARLLLGELAIASVRSCDTVLFMTKGRMSSSAMLEGYRWVRNNAMNLIVMEKRHFDALSDLAGGRSAIIQYLREWWDDQWTIMTSIRSANNHDLASGIAALDWIEECGDDISTMDAVQRLFPEWYSLGESLREGITRAWIDRQEEN